MPNESKNSRPISGLLSSLDTLNASAAERIRTPYEFRLISQAQARPYSLAFTKWVQTGRTGSAPEGTPAEIRASIYAQAETASELKAFVVVASVVIVELTDATIVAFNDGRIVVAHTALRCLIERIANASAVADAVSSLKSEQVQEIEIFPLLEVSEIITRALYGTQREWSAVVKTDLREAIPKDLRYVKKEHTADIGANNILKAIDKLDRKVPGTRNVYEVLCEFLHPNVGDLWATTTVASSFYDRYGTRHLVRTIGAGRKDLVGLPDQRAVYDQLFEICADIVAYACTVFSRLQVAAETADVLTKKWAHKVAKNSPMYCAPSDICPCLSGLTVKACRASTLRRRVRSK